MRQPRDLIAASLAACVWLAVGAASAAAPTEPAGRAMVTDRPSKTDGPFTLDAGRFQIEGEIFSGTRDREAGVDTRAWSVGSTFVRWGATPQYELQLGWQTYAQWTVDDAGRRSRASGLGDTVVRAKYNFWGNDGGPTALGLLPFAKFPTNQGGLGNDAIEPGCSLPWVINLPAGWQLGLMGKWSRLLDGDGRGRHDFMEYSAVCSHALTEKVSAYAEYWIGRSNEAGVARQETVGFGFGYAPSGRVLLDAGVNLGLNSAAPDVGFFCGYSVRY